MFSWYSAAARAPLARSGRAHAYERLRVKGVLVSSSRPRNTIDSGASKHNFELLITTAEEPSEVFVDECSTPRAVGVRRFCVYFLGFSCFFAGARGPGRAGGRKRAALRAAVLRGARNEGTVLRGSQ